MSLRKFDGMNFSYWKEKLQDYLIVKGQIDLIKNATIHTRTKVEEWKRMYGIAHASIRMHLSELVYYLVQSCATAHTLSETLLSMYKKKENATKLYLIWHLYNL